MIFVVLRCWGSRRDLDHSTRDKRSIQAVMLGGKFSTAYIPNQIPLLSFAFSEIDLLVQRIESTEH